MVTTEAEILRQTQFFDNPSVGNLLFQAYQTAGGGVETIGGRPVDALPISDIIDKGKRRKVVKKLKSLGLVDEGVAPKDAVVSLADLAEAGIKPSTFRVKFGRELKNEGFIEAGRMVDRELVESKVSGPFGEKGPEIRETISGVVTDALERLGALQQPDALSDLAKTDVGRGLLETVEQRFRSAEASRGFGSGASALLETSIGTQAIENLRRDRLAEAESTLGKFAPQLFPQFALGLLNQELQRDTAQDLLGIQLESLDKALDRARDASHFGSQFDVGLGAGIGAFGAGIIPQTLAPGRFVDLLVGSALGEQDGGGEGEKTGGGGEGKKTGGQGKSVWDIGAGMFSF